MNHNMQTHLRLHSAPENTLEARLEQGELIILNPCPRLLPADEERTFLFTQRLQSHKKNISYNPQLDTVTGFAFQTEEQKARLAETLREFSQQTTELLGNMLPRYAGLWRPDRASFRPEEEAIRRLRISARNDLLHIDAFPSRPSQGCRILRLFVNLHPTEPRVWITSDTFEKLLEAYGPSCGLPNLRAENWIQRLGQGLLQYFQPGSGCRTNYDRFMLRFHHFLKTNEYFQEHALKRFWHFPPGAAWLALTDSLSYADLRGRYALEHSFFIAPQSLVLPELAPAAILERACAMPDLSSAA